MLENVFSGVKLLQYVAQKMLKCFNLTLDFECTHRPFRIMSADQKILSTIFYKKLVIDQYTPSVIRWRLYK